MGRVFANPLTELIEFEEMNRELQAGRGPVQVSGCMDSQKVHLIQEIVPETSWKLIVTYDDSRAREIYEDFGCFRQDVWLYPAKDLLFYYADIQGNHLVRADTDQLPLLDNPQKLHLQIQGHIPDLISPCLCRSPR